MNYKTEASGKPRPHFGAFRAVLPESVSGYQLASYNARYADLIALGRQQNQSAKPKWAKDDERKLLNRMEK